MQSKGALNSVAVQFPCRSAPRRPLIADVGRHSRTHSFLSSWNMTQVHTIQAAGFDANISPFAFQFYAKDFLQAYKKHQGGHKFSPARFFLLTRSIELAAKALHLGQGRLVDDLRRLGHDLEAACDPSLLMRYGINITAAERTEVAKANEYYEGKGFEYFWFKMPGVPIDRSGPQQALSGWPNLPDEMVLEGLVDKLLAPKL